ncbi:MAG: prepilin-type N-terminal cleavage/methylation domain-containing protein [Verrucomicrobia bacterium]|nr:prepilin-type N-terminal cleavage/methylation domain-containing protein [Verrucomicrobiota bacterium]MDE3100462.1 prepilin-type N-terminal cleavage/methylation domain-containing protein [Verrucomicrobiota bacterium]
MCSGVKCRARPFGFSLVELLVVMGMIAILTALLLPALAEVKRRAQTGVCQSNLRQLALSDIMYVTDNNQFIQPDQGMGSFLGPNGEWMGALMDYYSRATNLLLCPTASAQPPGASRDGRTGPFREGMGQTGTANTHYIRDLFAPNGPGTSGWRFICGSYQANGWLYSSNGLARRDGPMIERANNVGAAAWCYKMAASVEVPARTPLFMDGVWVDAWPTERDSPATDLYTGQYASTIHDNEMGRFTIQRHAFDPAKAFRDYTAPWTPAGPGGAINVAFGDGHVELVRLYDLWDFHWHRGWAARTGAAVGTPSNQ